jgi:hypothetical protein
MFKWLSADPSRGQEISVAERIITTEETRAAVHGGKGSRVEPASRMASGAHGRKP